MQSMWKRKVAHFALRRESVKRGILWWLMTVAWVAVKLRDNKNEVGSQPTLFTLLHLMLPSSKLCSRSCSLRRCTNMSIYGKLSRKILKMWRGRIICGSHQRYSRWTSQHQMTPARRNGNICGILMPDWSASVRVKVETELSQHEGVSVGNFIGVWAFSNATNDSELHWWLTGSVDRPFTGESQIWPGPCGNISYDFLHHTTASHLWAKTPNAHYGVEICAVYKFSFFVNCKIYTEKVLQWAWWNHRRTWQRQKLIWAAANSQL